VGKTIRSEREWPDLGSRVRIQNAGGKVEGHKPLPIYLQTCKVKRGMSQYTKMMRAKDRRAIGKKVKVNIVNGSKLFNFYTRDKG